MHGRREIGLRSVWMERGFGIFGTGILSGFPDWGKVAFSNRRVKNCREWLRQIWREAPQEPTP